MNKKNISKIIALTLTVSAFSTIVPNIPMVSVGVEKAYAASTDYLEGITMETSKDKSVKLYKKSSCSSSSRLKDDDDVPTTLYAKVASSVSKVKITDLDFADDCELVEITKGSKDYDEDENISISSGSNTIKVVVKNKEDSKKKTYSIKVTRESTDKDDDSSSSYDDIYLDDIILKYSSDKIKFDFDKKKKSFDIKVKNNVSYVKVTAEPEDEDYTVRVDGSKVKESNDWESDKITLKEGKNEIIIKITDDDDNERQYTLNITREASSSSSTSSSSSSTSSSSTSTSNNTSNNNNNINNSKKGWKQENAKWCYYNDNGSKLSSTWFYDRSYGQTYYLDNNGDMSTGWLYNDSKWYYLGTNGAKTTGWQRVGGTWYYLDSVGVMQTGWFRDKDGKFYYLNPSGAMLSNTTVQGYKLGADGAWTGR